MPELAAGGAKRRTTHMAAAPQRRALAASPAAATTAGAQRMATTLSSASASSLGVADRPASHVENQLPRRAYSAGAFGAAANAATEQLLEPAGAHAAAVVEFGGTGDGRASVRSSTAIEIGPPAENLMAAGTEEQPGVGADPPAVLPAQHEPLAANVSEAPSAIAGSEPGPCDQRGSCAAQVVAPRSIGDAGTSAARQGEADTQSTATAASPALNAGPDGSQASDSALDHVLPLSIPVTLEQNQLVQPAPLWLCLELALLRG
ncbi:hypothetical protein PLESTF_000200300 [Pleodorina starrii]|nr:hypothetical protein PLESTF_000200300 [Pleodorina starrii]